MISVLFCDPEGVYSEFPGLDLWGLPDRDAMDWPGGNPVICHSPCQEYSIAKTCHPRRLPEPTFGFALAAVRNYGGVLEHPAKSLAFRMHGLPSPREGAGWQRTMCGGWTCCVWQGHYGHFAPKATWLYCAGANPPNLRWGPANTGKTLQTHSSHSTGLKLRNGTPADFARVMISIAESVI